MKKIINNKFCNHTPPQISTKPSTIILIIKIQLADVIKTYVNELFLKKIDTTFIRCRKRFQKNIYIFFPIKTF